MHSTNGYVRGAARAAQPTTWTAHSHAACHRPSARASVPGSFQRTHACQRTSTEAPAVLRRLSQQRSRATKSQQTSLVATSGQRRVISSACKHSGWGERTGAPQSVDRLPSRLRRVAPVAQTRSMRRTPAPERDDGETLPLCAMHTRSYLWPANVDSDRSRLPPCCIPPVLLHSMP